MAKSKEADAAAAVVDKINGWPEPHRSMGRRLHQIILETIPDIRPRLWYGMPGYAMSGPVLCFFRADDVMSFGLTEKVNVVADDESRDHLMGSAWFVLDLDKPTEARIAAILRRAIG